MRTVTFQSVLNGVAMLMGMDPNRDLNTPRANTLTEYINRRVAEGWRFDFFPEWTVAEQRYFRDPFFAGDFITAGDERYFQANGLYYQALRNMPLGDQAPATLSPDVYVENSAYWAESRQSYEARDWSTGTVFAVGDKTRNPDDNLQYQCHTAHTAGAAFDPTMFGVLKAFDKFVAYEQTGRTPIDEIKQVSRRNPRVFRDRLGKLDITPSDNGVQVETRAPSIVWVEFRLRPPVFTATRWVNGTAYDQGALVYYPPDCYVSAIGNNDQPVDGMVNWIKVPFPMLLESFVKRAVYADTLTDQKQQDRKGVELNEAYALLSDAVDYALAQQGQAESALVQTYGG